MEIYTDTLTKTENYIICLIRCLMWDQPVPPVPQDLPCRQLLDFSRRHSIEALVLRGLHCLDRNGQIDAQWQTRIDIALAKSIVQLQERDDVIAALTAAGIDVLPIKGCWLKELYPDINDRQMSDLDMLIHPKDALPAGKLLKKLGWQQSEVCYHHTTYKKPPYTALELHTSMLPDIDEHRHYYDNVWDKAQKQAPGLYRLKPEDEYIYYFLHLNKHLNEGGTGLRSVLDSLIYQRSFPEMDKAYVNSELDRLGLGTLRQQVEVLCRCWFESGEPVPEELQPMARAICDCGSLASLESRTRKRMEKLGRKYPNPIIRFFAYSLPRFFRPLSEMRRRYPILDKLPVLLPVFWVVRLISMMIHNEKGFWQHLRSLFGKGESNG